MRTRAKRTAAAAAILVLGLGLQCVDLRADRYESVMVYSENFNGYKRTRLGHGVYKPETFAFAEGERFNSFVANNDANELSFHKVVWTLAKPLAQQSYLAATDANHTDLLIMVSWGVTHGTRDDWPMMMSTSGGVTFYSETGLHGYQDVYNARLLGYAGKLQFAMDVPWFSAAQDIFSEIQESRYFVILQAFDFQTLRKEHRQKLLWESRFSIVEQGNDFGKELAGMAQRASQFFGNGNGRLVRRAYPKGSVHLGEPIPVKEDALRN